MTGCVEGILRVLVLGLVLIVGTAIEQTLSVGPTCKFVWCDIMDFGYWVVSLRLSPNDHVS